MFKYKSLHVIFLLSFFSNAKPNSFSDFKVSNQTAPQNGVEGEQRLMKKLKSSIPSLWPPVDMVNRTVFIYIDLFKIQEVDEKVMSL